MAGELTLRLKRGDAVVKLQGDAAAVQAALADLKANGLGALAPFFGLGVSPVGTIGQPGVQPGAQPGPTPPLTNPAKSFRFVFDSMILPLIPASEQEFATDVNGDGRPENRFAKIIAVVVPQLFDLQGFVDAELQTGQIIMLLTMATELATPAPDQRAAVTLLAGKPVQPSARVYTVDASVPPVTVQGRIVAGRFASDDPLAGGLVVERDIRIPFGPGATATVAVQGLRLAFDVAVDGSAILNGQLTGSVKQADVESQLVPAFATMITHMIQVDPGSSTAQTIRQILDLGGCTNPDGTVAQAGDGVIDVCELLTSPLFRTLLQPDVQIWDAQGNYAPNPLGGNTDSMSLGLGFSAAAASY